MNKSKIKKRYKKKKRFNEWREFWRRILFGDFADMVDWKIRNKQ